jgi:hypothetical protein
MAAPRRRIRKQTEIKSDLMRELGLIDILLQTDAY